MRRRIGSAILATIVAGACFLAAFLYTRRTPVLSAAVVLAAFDERGAPAPLTITYPQDGTLFPPELVPPTFTWEPTAAGADLWVVRVAFEDGGGPVRALLSIPSWRPSDPEWEAWKRRTRGRWARLAVVGVRRAEPETVLAAGEVRFSTSEDEVGAPLFYREVNLPFIDAVKDPSHIRWRFGPISTPGPPPVVLEGLPVCGNCHSFSRDGALLGMDIDYANDKGSYAIVPVEEETRLTKERVITWSDFRREDGDKTFGLLSQVSPDGRWVVSTVKDRSVFVPQPGLDFSQLFFPVKGILACYHRETGTFVALPGADDPAFVQSNPTWSPDGKTLLFARARAYELKTDRGGVLLTREECREFLEEGKTFRFDLYRIPFNDCAGGEPEPLEGASGNGMSNFFPRVSPDGRWVVFSKAKSFMLLQPDSELYIVPSQGGTPRRMRCNTSRMNSWHSWSPNGRWLVFSSKQHGPYTQLFLTHVDEQGRDTPAVLLDHLTAPDRAANIPEFVDVAPQAIRTIREEFVDALSFLRAGHESVDGKDYEGAVRAFGRALELAPDNVEAHKSLALSLLSVGRPEEAAGGLLRALESAPQDPEVHANLGLARQTQGRLDDAVRHYGDAIRLDPGQAEAHNNLGIVLELQGRREEAIGSYERALALDPGYAKAHNNLGLALQALGRPLEAVPHHERAVARRPDYAEAQFALGRALVTIGRLQQATARLERALELEPDHVGALNNLGIALARQGRLQPAREHFERAVRLAPGNADAHANLGLALDKLGRREEARVHVEEARRLRRERR